MFGRKEDNILGITAMSYYGNGLWRCNDGSLRKADADGKIINYATYDVGPFDFYLRIPIPAGLRPDKGRIQVLFGEGTSSGQVLGGKLLNSDRVSTLADMNFPRSGIVWDDTLSMLGVSWHMQVAPDCVVATQHFLDKTVFEFYSGGEKPFYQCHMAVMAHWEAHAVTGSCVFPESMAWRRLEKCWIVLTLEGVPEVDFDLFIKFACRRHRGVC